MSWWRYVFSLSAHLPALTWRSQLSHFAFSNRVARSEGKNHWGKVGTWPWRGPAISLSVCSLEVFFSLHDRICVGSRKASWYLRPSPRPQTMPAFRRAHMERRAWTRRDSGGWWASQARCQVLGPEGEVTEQRSGTSGENPLSVLFINHWGGILK